MTKPGCHKGAGWLLLVLGGLAAGCVGAWVAPPTPLPVPAARGDAEALPSGGRGGQAGTFPAEPIDVCGVTRTYRLVVPPSVSPDRPAPLVFAFHGIFESKDYMPLYSHLDGLAAAKGFILVYPEGEGHCWPLALEWSREDLAFFDALYAHLTGQYNVDLNRVYLTGMSNGAYFSSLVALQRSDRVAAIAVHSGGLSCTWPELLGSGEVTVAAKRKFPVMIVHGDADPIVSVEEGRRARDTYKRWGHEVEYVELHNHTHVWANDQGINERIWKFFMDHPRR